MTDQQQPRPGDRVRVTFEATASFSSEKGLTVILPGDDEFAQRFCVVPAHATVEVLKPPTLAERMATLADGLEAEPGYGGYGDGLSRAVSRIRAELAAHAQETCGMRYSHGPKHPTVACTLPADHAEQHNWLELLGVDQ